MNLLVVRAAGTRESATLLRGALADALGEGWTVELTRTPPGRGGPARVVSWGLPLPGALNGAGSRNKLTQARQLAAAGVPTVAVRTAPAPEEPGWLWRSLGHAEGRDLDQQDPTQPPPQRPSGFYTQYHVLEHEFRVHVCLGAVRLGVKYRLGTAQSHPWIRAHRLGWGVAYEGRLRRLSPSVREAVTVAACQALRAVGLDFGACDVGYSTELGVVVLEVNSAPGLTAPGVLQWYTTQLAAWARREERIS